MSIIPDSQPSAARFFVRSPSRVSRAPPTAPSVSRASTTVLSFSFELTTAPSLPYARTTSPILTYAPITPLPTCALTTSSSTFSTAATEPMATPLPITNAKASPLASPLATEALRTASSLLPRTQGLRPSFPFGLMGPYPGPAATPTSAESFVVNFRLSSERRSY